PRGVKERRGTRLERLLQAACGEAITRRALTLLGVGQVGGNDVEEQGWNPSIRQMCCNSAAHDTCSQDSCAADRGTHAGSPSKLCVASWTESLFIIHKQAVSTKHPSNQFEVHQTSRGAPKCRKRRTCTS